MALIREVHPDTLAALSRTVIHPVALVELEWPGETIRAHTNGGAIVWGGRTFRGVGAFGSVALPDEGGGLASQPATLRLVGLGPELDADLAEDVRGIWGRVWAGVTTERGGNVLIGEPIESYVGYLDVMQGLFRAADGRLERGVEIALAPGPSQREGAEVYHTAEDQARRHPGDTAGRHVQHADAEAARFTWPG